MKNWLLVIAMAVLLAGCAEPLPENRLDYVGQWRSKEMSLLILADGSVAYERLKRVAPPPSMGPCRALRATTLLLACCF